jgi:hypothetical protein
MRDLRSSQSIDALGEHELLNLESCRNTPYSRILPGWFKIGSTGASGMQLELKMPSIGSIWSSKALWRLRYACVSVVGCRHKLLNIDCAERVSSCTARGCSSSMSSPLMMGLIATAPLPCFGRGSILKRGRAETDL